MEPSLTHFEWGSRVNGLALILRLIKRVVSLSYMIMQEKAPLATFRPAPNVNA